MKHAPQATGNERRVQRTVELHGPDHGTSLAALLETLHRKTHRVPVHVAIYITHELARGLRYIHQVEGRVHGAVRAENVLLLRTGQVRLIDRRITPVRADRHSDVRDVGQIAWEMLVGWPLGDGSEQARERPAPLAPSLLRAGLPGPIDELVLRALELDPRRRYPGPNALASDCAQFLGTRPDPRRGLRLLLDQLLGGEPEPPPSPDSTATRLTAVPWRDGAPAAGPSPIPPAAPARRTSRWLRRLGLRVLETTIASILALLALLALTRAQRPDLPDPGVPGTTTTVPLPRR